MTTEELLKPRYKVIADYFYNPYKIGDIITVEYEDRSVRLTETSYRDEFGETVKQANNFHPDRLKDYPHLFKPLQWWEERKPEDMPEYVRCIKTPDQIIQPDEVLKVTWNSNGGKVENGQWIFPYTNCYEPATKEGYEAYLQPTNQLKDGD